MATPTLTHCPGCGKPLSYYQSAVHPKSTRPPTWIGTCNTQGCDYHEKTASDVEWLAFSTDKAEQERYKVSCVQRDEVHQQFMAKSGH